MVKDLDAWHDAAREPQRVKHDWVTQPQEEEREFHFEPDTNIAPENPYVGIVTTEPQNVTVRGDRLFKEVIF